MEKIKIKWKKEKAKTINTNKKSVNSLIICCIQISKKLTIKIPNIAVIYSVYY